MEKMTRQGVRDLNVIKAPPRQRRTLEGLPDYMIDPCKHPRFKKHNDNDGTQHCSGCGKSWDFNGREIVRS